MCDVLYKLLPTHKHPECECTCTFVYRANFAEGVTPINYCERGPPNNAT